MPGRLLSTSQPHALIGGGISADRVQLEVSTGQTATCCGLHACQYRSNLSQEANIRRSPEGSQSSSQRDDQLCRAGISYVQARMLPQAMKAASFVLLFGLFG